MAWSRTDVIRWLNFSSVLAPSSETAATLACNWLNHCCCSNVGTETIILFSALSPKVRFRPAPPGDACPNCSNPSLVKKWKRGNWAVAISGFTTYVKKRWEPTRPESSGLATATAPSQAKTIPNNKSPGSIEKMRFAPISSPVSVGLWKVPLPGSGTVPTVVVFPILEQWIDCKQNPLF